MTDLLAIAASWLDGRRRAYMAQTVTYARAGSTVELLATGDRSQCDVERSDGSIVRSETRDWIVTAADLLLDGAAFEPAAGDEVRATVGGQAVTYTVVSPAGEPCWQWEDGAHVTIRLRTKETER